MTAPQMTEKGILNLNDTILKQYAELIAVMGVNVQPGQDVLIEAQLDQPAFVELVTEACYRAGARSVRVDWRHQPLERLHAQFQAPEVLAEVRDWEKARLQNLVDTLPCRIYLLSEDPDGLSGVDTEKLAAAAQSRRRAAKPYRDQMENRYQWCIAAVPGAAWARKLFPGLDADAAQKRLWDAILSASRAMERPIPAWQAHNRDLKDRCRYLNQLGIRSLHYTASNGTDLTVGMMAEGRFRGGADTSLNGVTFNPNIPSEEVFISPRRGEAEGVVHSSMPLSYQGQLIENFTLRFAHGRVEELHAEKNEALLQKLVSMDEGAAFLGECALVPYDSPIRSAGLLFYNTLFDENAACHLALGAGFCDTVDGFENRSLEECRSLGVNDSIIHEDFMIGTADLDIDAETFDGRTVPIFRSGNWAF